MSMDDRNWWVIARDPGHSTIAYGPFQSQEAAAARARELRSKHKSVRVAHLSATAAMRAE